MLKKIFIIILIFVLSITSFAQETTDSSTLDIPDPASSPPDYPRKAKSSILPVTLLSAGFLLQIIGTTLGIEANRKFIAAAEANARYDNETDATAKDSYHTKYLDAKSSYDTYLYTSIALISAGSISTLTGLIFAILYLNDKSTSIDTSETSTQVTHHTGFPSISLSSKAKIYIQPNSIEMRIK